MILDDEEEPFEIKRKLLRRRHVRKEQIRAKRRREETKNLTAKANVAITEEKVRQQLEPQIQQHKRKRTIVHAPSKRLKLEMKRTDTAAIITPKSSPKLLTSRRRLVDKFNESVDPNVLCLATLVSSSMNHKLKVQLHGDRHRTPPFSPVRPSSKYHHRKRLLR